jgi:glutathione S-transferase
MKLYYSAGSCSTSCHIVLEESGLPYEAIEIDWDNQNDPNIAVIEKLNPLGTLPVFITEGGMQLDQNIAIQTFVADLAQDSNLLPPLGTTKRAEANNWMSFVCSDLHKSIGGMFSIRMLSSDAKVQASLRTSMLEKANQYLDYLNTKLEGKDYLMGSTFIAADAYAFVVLGWTQWLEVPLTSYSNIEKYMARIAARPAVARVMKAEGLL